MIDFRIVLNSVMRSVLLPSTFNPNCPFHVLQKYSV